MTLKEKFGDAIDKIIMCCRKKNLLFKDYAIDPDMIAAALLKRPH